MKLALRIKKKRTVRKSKKAFSKILDILNFDTALKMMPDSTVQENSFSDDSLEETVKSKRKVQLSKRKQTYLQLYERRLTKEFLITKHKSTESKCYPSRAESPSTSEELTERNQSPVKYTTQKRKLSISRKAPLTLWSEYLSEKNKLNQSKSEVNEKIEALRARLNYGKQINSINKFNKMCLEMKKRRKTLENTSSDEKSFLQQSSACT